MAVIEMQKVAVIAHAPLQEAVIQQLHKEGVLQVTLGDTTTNTDHSAVAYRAADLQYAIDTLSNVAEKETIVVSQKVSTEADIEHAATHTDVLGIVEELRSLEAVDTQAEKEIQDARLLQKTLSGWEKLPFALNTPKESVFTITELGTLPKQSVAAVRDELYAKNVKVELATLDTTEEGLTTCVAYVWKDDHRTFEEITTTHGWTSVSLPEFESNAAIILEEAKLQEMELLKKQEANLQKRKQLSVELPNLIKVSKFMKWLDQKQDVRNSLTQTSDTVTIFGWMEKAKTDIVGDHLQKEHGAVALLKVKPEPGEEAPVALRNSKLLTPFESVTTLYGLPLTSEGDPTRALSPFFILYFGLCLTDAGYGATIALIFGIYLWVSKKSIEEAKLWWLLFMSGIVTFFVSIPFGGWFGLSPDQVPEFLTYVHDEKGRLFLGQIWNLNTEQGINFLQNLSLALGLTHIFFGMYLAGVHKWIHGKKAAAFWEDFTSHLLLGAVIFKFMAPESMATTATYILYAVIALTIWGKGYGNAWYLRPIFGLLGVVNLGIGLLSNGLSYLRILALGLVTGAIAMAVNQVAVELGNLFPPFIGIPIIILIFIGGHSVSIALNTLGSFIHSGRLQFIEFFSQFFEGGGRSFSPFKRSTL